MPGAQPRKGKNEEEAFALPARSPGASAAPHARTGLWKSLIFRIWLTIRIHTDSVMRNPAPKSVCCTRIHAEEPKADVRIGDKRL